MSFLFGKFHIEERKAWAVTVLLILCYYMLAPGDILILNIFRESFYLCIVPVLVAATLYFHRVQGSTDQKLLLVFWLWFWLSRVLNGSPALDHDFELFFDLSLMIPFFAVGTGLTKGERARFLDWLSTVVGGFYFILGLLALKAFFQQSAFFLPFAKNPVGFLPESGYGRIIILDDNANTSAFWYFIVFSLMIYQFFHCEKKLWRIPILLSAVLDLLVISVTRSRSIWFCTALVFAMLAAILLMQALQNRTRFVRISLAFFTAVLVLIASYELSSLSSAAMTAFSYRISDAQAVQKKTNPAETDWAEARRSIRPMLLSSGKKESPEAAMLLTSPQQRDPQPESEALNNASFSRRQIWRGAFQTIKENPSILWKGHLCDTIIIAAYGFITSDGSGQLPWNFYNSPIQVLMTTGLPGLFLTVSFLALVLYRGLRLSLCFKAPLATRTLVLPVVATMPYFMLEAGLFSAIDVRMLLYFLICGLMLGFARDWQKGL